MKNAMRQRWLWYTFSFGILAASGIFVHVIRPDPQSILHNPLRIIFLMGALPWFLQCASVAMMFYCVFDAGKHRSSIVLPAFVAVASVGVVWWGGIMMACWHSDLSSLLVNALSYDMRRQYAVESSAELFLFEVAGPLTCPALLNGPLLLTGWNYLWCLLSSSGVIALWTWVGHLFSRVLAEDRRSLKLSLATLGLLLYIAPVIFRATMRVAQHSTF
jgi:hypothetical protein